MAGVHELIIRGPEIDQAFSENCPDLVTWALSGQCDENKPVGIVSLHLLKTLLTICIDPH